MALVAMPLALVALAGLVGALAVDIHSVISTLCKAVLLLSVVGDDSTIDGARVVSRNASNHNSVRTRRLSIVSLSVGQDGEFEVWLLGVREAEMLIVIVSMGVWHDLLEKHLGLRFAACYSHLSFPIQELETRRTVDVAPRLTQSLALRRKLQSLLSSGIDGLLAVVRAIAVAARRLIVDCGRLSRHAFVTSECVTRLFAKDRA